jgi:hypothetical protein
MQMNIGIERAKKGSETWRRDRWQKKQQHLFQATFSFGMSL